jgi:hypothetical protein
MLAKILDATTTSEQIMATMEVMEYLQDLQKAVMEKHTVQTRVFGKNRILEIVAKISQDAFSGEDDPTPSQRNKMAIVLNEMLR